MKAGPRQPAGRMIDEGSSTLGSGRVAGSLDAHRRPGAHRLFDRGVGLVEREALRQEHFLARRQAGLEADAAQVVGRRGEGIGQAGPQVDLAVAVAIDAPLHEGRGHELHVAHGAGPRAAHLLAGHAVHDEDAQRLHRLVAEEGGALGHAAERRHRAHDLEVAHVAAVVRLEAPERHDVLRRHAVLGLQGVEQGAVLRHLLLALGDALGRHRGADILGVGQREFRLARIEVDHLLVGREALEGAVGDLGRHALAQRVGLDVLQAGLEVAPLRVCGSEAGSGKERRHCGEERDS